jgi:hypothetical protein
LCIESDTAADDKVRSDDEQEADAREPRKAARLVVDGGGRRWFDEAP